MKSRKGMSFQFLEDICKYPFLRFVIPFIIGIALSILFDIHYFWGLGIFIIAGIIFLILSFKNKYKLLIPIGINVNLLFIGLGIFITSFHLQSNNYEIEDLNSGFLIAELYRDPKINASNTILNVEILAIRNKNTWTSASGRSILYLSSDDKSSQLRVGDRIIFNPQLSEIENRGNPNEFDYKKYLAFNLILSSDFLSSDDWKSLPSDSNLKFGFKLLRFRQTVLELLSENGLSDDELAVLSALALGYKDKLNDEIRHNYAASGAMHILAVSGLHVGVIYTVLVFVFSFIRNKKTNYFKIPIIITIIWLYACLTGLSPSVCRAALMLTIISVGRLNNRSQETLNSLAASAFILLFINPLDIMSVGFQLSYLAVLGIVLIQPKIYQMLEVKNWLLDKIWLLVSVSIAAQIAVAPLSIYYFNSFSSYFIITNILLIPIANLAIWTFLIACVFIKIKIIATIIIQILSLLIMAMNHIVMFIESLPYSVLDNLYIDVTSTILLYLLIVFLSIFFFTSRKYKDLVYCLILVAFLLIVNIYEVYKNNKQKYVIVYNIYKSTAINIIDGRDNILFVRLDSTYDNRAKTITKNTWIEKGISGEKYINLLNKKKTIVSDILTIDNDAIFWKKNLIVYEGVKIYVLDDSFIPFKPNDDFKRIFIDYIVLSSNPNVSLDSLSKYFSFKKIIVDSSNSLKFVEKICSENEKFNFNLFFVNNNSAFVLEL